MCGRFQFDLTAANEFYGIAGRLAGFKTGEVFPTNSILVLSGSGEPSVMTWGYPRFGSKSGSIINARSETAHERPMFRKSLAERRCIIPTTGFFEWDGQKQKHRFNLPHTRALYLAGLWNEFDGILKCVILTTAANPSMDGIHDRMPVVLSQSILDDWLNSRESTYAILHETPPTLKHVPAS